MKTANIMTCFEGKIWFHCEYMRLKPSRVRLDRASARARASEQSERGELGRLGKRANGRT
jgi:hypothetical protein